MEMTFLILYCRLNGQGNQKGLIWDNLLPLSKMSYQEKSPCKSPFCMVVAQQVSRKNTYNFNFARSFSLFSSVKESRSIASSAVLCWTFIIFLIMFSASVSAPSFRPSILPSSRIFSSRSSNVMYSTLHFLCCLASFTCRHLALEYVWQEAFHDAIHNFIIAWAGNSTSWKHLVTGLGNCLLPGGGKISHRRSIVYVFYKSP